MHDHHDHDHSHSDTHGHSHTHDHCEHTHSHTPEKQHAHTHHGTVLVLRPTTGISGDIMVAGLARMLDADQALIDACIAEINVPELAGSVSISPHSLQEVSGWRCAVTLPHEHAHRNLADIRAIIDKSHMANEAKELAQAAFALLAEAEGSVHGKKTDEVSFHEVGALDSILDTCLAACLFTKLNPTRFICGSLPLCDGTIKCAHGKLPAPAPAVLRLLHTVPVHGIASQGETVTPTGIALLKAFGAEFGIWPPMTLEHEAIIYGTRVFPNVANGAIFAFGRSHTK